MKRLPLDLILLLAAVAVLSAWLCVRSHNKTHNPQTTPINSNQPQ